MPWVFFNSVINRPLCHWDICPECFLIRSLRDRTGSPKEKTWPLEPSGYDCFLPSREIDGRDQGEDTPPQMKGRFVPDLANESLISDVEKYKSLMATMEPKTKSEGYKPILPKKMHELTDEELWLMCRESNCGKVSIDTVKDHDLPKLRNYWRQTDESGGFDLDENPNIGLPPAPILKAVCCQKTAPKRYQKYMTLAQFAIDETFNKKTDLEVLKIESANMVYCYAKIYFLTFTVSNTVKAGGSVAADSASKTFQACVRTC